MVCGRQLAEIALSPYSHAAGCMVGLHHRAHHSTVMPSQSTFAASRDNPKHPDDSFASPISILPGLLVSSSKALAAKANLSEHHTHSKFHERLMGNPKVCTTCSRNFESNT
jgi:hypothetical protein